MVSQSESWVGKVSSFNPCGPERVLDRGMFAFKKDGAAIPIGFVGNVPPHVLDELKSLVLSC